MTIELTFSSLKFNFENLETHINMCEQEAQIAEGLDVLFSYALVLFDNKTQ